ncbi:GntR family transcriptional regulator [Egibacter rhizosphaerae]|nr:GntR family transcriptional regulator [Egibacter rhizosphaerae]
MDEPDETSHLSRSMLSDRAYEALHERIINLELEPGQRLNIDRLSRELGVSPTPLRDALRRLADEDLVGVQPFKGFYVAPLLDIDEIHELAEVRALIEAHSVERPGGAASGTVTDLRKEVELMDGLIEADELDLRGFNGADARFHTTLVASAGNPMLERTYRKLNAHVQIARLFIGRGRVDARQANDEHRRIVAALTEGDLTKARAELTAHIQGVADRLGHEGEAVT